MLNRRDHQLSMRISPRARSEQDNDGWRTLIVNRLRDASKLVVRLPNKTSIATAHSGRYTVHCEDCNKWFGLPDWGEEIQCPKCGGVFVLEAAVFSRLPAPAEVAQAASTVTEGLTDLFTQLGPPPSDSIGALADGHDED